MKGKIVRFMPYALPVVFVALIASSFFVPVHVHAEAASGSVSATELNTFSIELFKKGKLTDIIAFFINLFLLAAGIVAFIMALYGGFVYLTAGGDAGKASTGRTIIVNAIIGIIIIAIAYVLIQYFVNLRSNVGSGEGVGNGGRF